MGKYIESQLYKTSHKILFYKKDIIHVQLQRLRNHKLKKTSTVPSPVFEDQKT